jgi:hypothetical protein
MILPLLVLASVTLSALVDREGQPVDFARALVLTRTLNDPSILAEAIASLESKEEEKEMIERITAKVTDPKSSIETKQLLLHVLMAWRTCTAEDDHKWFWIRSEVKGAITFHAVSDEMFTFSPAEISLTVQARLLGQVIAEEVVSWDFGVLPSSPRRDIDGSGLRTYQNQAGGFRVIGTNAGISTLWEATKRALVDKGITLGDADELGDPQHSNILDSDGVSFEVSGPSAEDWWDYARSHLRSTPYRLDWIFFRFGDANLLVWGFARLVEFDREVRTPERS